MDWMYKGVSGIVDREDYLTGRKIDKTFEILEKEENPDAQKGDDDGLALQFQNHLVAAAIQSPGDPMSMSQSDLAAKMREDPLFEIKMKQMEQRKQLLKNPMQLKKLKEALKASLEKDKKHKKRKKTKKKKDSSNKKKSKRKHHSSDDDSSDDFSSERNDDDSDDDETRSRHKRTRQSPIAKPSSESTSHHRHHRRKSPEKTAKTSRSQKHRPPPSPPHRSTYGAGGKRRTKITEEELERRRQEMKSNAEWRENTRRETVQRLNQREREEEERDRKVTTTGSGGFIKPMLTGMAERTSVEESVRRKRFQSQRGVDNMDRNFARKY